MDSLVITVATYALYAVALGALSAWLLGSRRDKARLAVAAVVALAAALLSVKVAGALWVDPRPFVVDGQAPLVAHGADNGFPSDHTTMATAIALVVLSVRRRLGAALVAVAVLLGAARVAAHLHHVPDVVGGLLVGALCAAVAVLVARRVVAYAVAHGAAGGLRPERPLRASRPGQGQRDTGPPA